MIWKLYLTLNDFSSKMKERDIGTYAASTAFFFFLSVVPMLIMIWDDPGQRTSRTRRRRFPDRS